jgi:hypothetical protein
MRCMWAAQPRGSPMSCKQSKHVTRSKPDSLISFALASLKLTRSPNPRVQRAVSPTPQPASATVAPTSAWLRLRQALAASSSRSKERTHCAKQAGRRISPAHTETVRNECSTFCSLLQLGVGVSR